MALRGSRRAAEFAHHPLLRALEPIDIAIRERLLHQLARHPSHAQLCAKPDGPIALIAPAANQQFGKAGVTLQASITELRQSLNRPGICGGSIT